MKTTVEVEIEVQEVKCSGCPAVVQGTVQVEPMSQAGDTVRVHAIHPAIDSWVGIVNPAKPFDFLGFLCPKCYPRALTLLRAP